ncbi:MAG: hypothetical protein QGI45_15770 [Myxococcota bacterium]|jgi:hypothetical protein|nr:hypothetical protein [Myxococcota bacterium]
MPWTEMTQSDVERKALRFARAIVSDIGLYNADKIIESLKSDTFFEVLGAELEEGRQLYESRLDPELKGHTFFYEHAIVDVVIKSQGKVDSFIW